jgi:hypothetical protein
MMNDPARPSNALLAEISRDLKPVRPSPPPLGLTLRILPVAVCLSLAILTLMGQRHDAGTIGFFMTWGASTIQFGFGMLLVWIAARESTPARRLPIQAVRLVVVAVLFVVVAITLRTFALSPTKISKSVLVWRMGLFCGVGSTIMGLLLVFLLASVFRRSLAAHPVLTGALYGAGAGVAVNSGWRLACSISAPEHSLLAHGTAIIATSILGALMGYVMEKRERRSISQR